MSMTTTRPNMNEIVGTCDILWIVLDTLRYDVACTALAAGQTPHLAALLPSGAWEERHTPGSFTYSAHHAFFAGFLPTPKTPGPHPRLFAAEFDGSESTDARTYVFKGADLPTGLRDCGYHCACIGGVGFFNKRTPLSRAFTDLFDESHWSVEMGVTDASSTKHQIARAVDVMARLPEGRRLFLFINISALHQPNCIFLDGATVDSKTTMAAALTYVDSQLPPLLEALRQRGDCFFVIASDHGTAYGEDGYHGHRLAHPAVWTVPYAHGFLDGCDG